MKRTFLKAAAGPTLAILGLAPAVQAQAWTSLIKSNAGYMKISVLDSRRLFVFSQPGTLLRSADGGATWMQAALPDSTGSFQATHPDTAWAWRQNTLYRSVDGASSWMARKDAGFRVYGSQFLNGSQGFLTTENGGLHATLDGGATWIQRRPAERKGFTLMDFPDPARGYAVEADSSGTFPWTYTAIKTSDSGKTWTPLAIPQDLQAAMGYFQSLRFTSALQGVVAIQTAAGSSVELSTQDGGASWSRRDILKPDSIAFHGSLGASFLYGVFKKGPGVGKPVVSRDGGATWIPTAATFPGRVESMAWRHPDTGWAVGPGFVFKTVDGGATWTQQIATLTGQDLVQDILFQDPLVGWAAVGRRMYRTTDGGGIWSLLSASTTTEWKSLYIADPAGSRALLALGKRPASVGLADAEVIGVSRDQGSSWKEFEPDRPLRLLDIAFGSARTGYALANHTSQDSLGLLKTADQGDSWQFLPLPYRARGYKIQFLDENDGYLAVYGLDGSGTFIVRIGQGGATSGVVAQFPYNGFAGMHWEDVRRGWVLSGDTVHRTLDGGATWSKTGLGTWKNSGRAVALDARNVAVYSSLNRKLLRTADGFATWSVEELPIDIRELQFFPSGEGYALGGQGQMMRYSAGPVPVRPAPRPTRRSAGKTGPRFESGRMRFYPDPEGRARIRATDASGRRIEALPGAG